jgi:hypothetical protein
MYVVLHFFLRFHFPWSCITAEFANIDDSVYKKAKNTPKPLSKPDQFMWSDKPADLRNLLEAL